MTVNHNGMPSEIALTIPIAVKISPITSDSFQIASPSTSRAKAAPPNAPPAWATSTKANAETGNEAKCRPNASASAGSLTSMPDGSGYIKKQGISKNSIAAMPATTPSGIDAMARMVAIILVATPVAGRGLKLRGGRDREVRHLRLHRQHERCPHIIVGLTGADKGICPDCGNLFALCSATYQLGHC